MTDNESFTTDVRKLTYPIYHSNGSGPIDCRDSRATVTVRSDTQHVVEFNLPSMAFDEQPIRNLYYWSLNYDCGKNPWCLFCDLVGWSHYELGETLYKNDPSDVLGHVELRLLIEALSECQKIVWTEIYDLINDINRGEDEDED